MNSPDLQKPRRGCMFYACIFGSILIILVLTGVAVGYLTVRKAINTWTQTQPAQLPREQISQAEAVRLQERIQTFRSAVEADAQAQPLVLSTREINGLIASGNQFAELRDKLFVDIKDGRAQGQISLPLDHIGIGFLKGRYLNGTAEIKSTFEEGKLRLNINSMQVNGKPVPETLMSRIRGVNFAQKLNEDPKASALLSKLASIKVQDDQLQLMPTNAPAH